MLVLTTKDLEELLWVLQDSQVSEDVNFGPAVGMYQERRKRLIKLVKQELKVRGIKL